MDRSLIVPNSHIVDVYDYSPLDEAAQVANEIAARNLFQDYRKKRAPNTIARHDYDLFLFAKFLMEAERSKEVNPPLLSQEAMKEAIKARATYLANEPNAWTSISWGIVSGFVRWLLQKGYAIGSINLYLTTVKVYAGMAKQAGKLSQDQYTSIMLIKGYRHNEGQNVDTTREKTRVGDKKAESNTLTKEQAHKLKNNQPDTPQGRRDAVMMCLLLDHGLRVGELASLTRKSIRMSVKGDNGRGTVIFDRPKVDLKAQIHELSIDTERHLKAYLKHEKPTGQLLKGSRKGQEALIEGMSIRAIKARVRYLGLVIGIPNLSPHDCRHTVAFFIASNKKNSLFQLQEFGGWKSLHTPRIYVERAKIANQGIEL